MRLLHTADWHLGRVLHGAPLIEDQAYVLDQLVDLCERADIDAVLVAGDVYDRGVPAPDAVALLDDVLTRLVLERRVPVVMIAGNHDSPARLGFASRVLHGQGLYVRGFPEAHPEPIVLRDDHGDVHVIAVPFAEPSLVRERVAPDVHDHDAAFRVLQKRGRAAVPEGARTVLMAHAFVAGGEPSESERPLSVGGAGQVQPRRFFGFDYVALGHLHRPQRIGADHVQYSGSLLKYSFEEAAQPKSVNVVDLGGDGRCQVERVALRPRRDVRCIEGTLADVLADAPADGRDDYLAVTLLDREPVYDPIGKLRAVYPNVLQIERPFIAVDADVGQMVDHRRVDAQMLFDRFFAEVTGEELTEEQRRVFAGAVEDLRREDREAVT